MDAVNNQCESIFEEFERELSARKKVAKLSRRELRSMDHLPNGQCIQRLNDALAGIIVDLGRWAWGEHCHIDRAILHTLYAEGNYQKVHENIILATDQHWRGSFPKQLYQEIEDLWAAAAYQMQSKKPVEKLSAVDKYRIRKRNSCPITSWVGGRRYNISAEAKYLLEEHFKGEEKPGKEAKMLLARRTGLRMATISNWFKNRRQRRTRSMSLNSIESASDQSATTTIKSEPAEPTLLVEPPTIYHHRPTEPYLAYDCMQNDSITEHNQCYYDANPSYSHQHYSAFGYNDQYHFDVKSFPYQPGEWCSSAL